jgi:SAM-dependent methyltransferase
MTPPPLLRLADLPVNQNKLFARREEALACARGDVVLAQDAATGVVCNQAFDPALVEYDPSYQNEQGHSSAFQAHLVDVAGVVERHFAGRDILEVGCGKGAFLQQLRARGHAARGIDPAYEGDDPGIVRALFAPGLGIRADALVLRHTLEHIADPLAFLASLRDANGGQGLIYIEVPCLDWILEHRAWFDFFYEHVNYLRLADFARLFGRVLESGRLFGGQYLYAVADLATLRAHADVPRADPVVFPADLFRGLDAARALGVSGRGAIWGAAAKGVMFAHHAMRAGVPLDLAIDINPAKQSGFLPGTGLPVLAPEAALARLGDGARIYVMNSNYLDEIRRAGGDRHAYIQADRQ